MWKATARAVPTIRRSTMKKIKIAQIGTSRFSHGVSIWRSLRKQSDVFEVVGYALPEGEREKFPEWANDYDPDFGKLLTRDPDYTKRVFAIGRGGKKPRKDFGTWGECKGYMGFFFDELFAVTESFPEGTDLCDVKSILLDFAEQFDASDDQGTWFDKIKAIADKYGYASDMKAYKADPTVFKGSVADVSSFMRLSVTGRLSSPDMYEVMQILGKDRVKARLTEYANSL